MPDSFAFGRHRDREVLESLRRQRSRAGSLLQMIQALEIRSTVEDAKSIAFEAVPHVYQTGKSCDSEDDSFDLSEISLQANESLGDHDGCDDDDPFAPCSSEESSASGEGPSRGTRTARKHFRPNVDPFEENDLALRIETMAREADIAFGGLSPGGSRAAKLLSMFTPPSQRRAARRRSRDDVPRGREGSAKALSESIVSFDGTLSLSSLCTASSDASTTAESSFTHLAS